MSIFKLPILFMGSKGQKELLTLIDSGNEFSCINFLALENLELPVRLKNPRKLPIPLKSNYIEIIDRVALDFYINDVLLSDEFFVVKNFREDASIGSNTLRKWRIKLDFEHDQIIVDPKSAKLQLI